MTGLRQLLVALSLAAASVAAGAQSYSGLYVFGDSLSDSGNVAALLGTDPGQTITGNSYIPSLPYASGQFTNADVWVKAFAVALGLGPYGSPALLGGGDFAFGGARVATSGLGDPPSLAQQAQLYLLGAPMHQADAGALYVVAGGGNDARDALGAAATSSDPFGVIAAAASLYAAQTGAIIDQLQAAGAQHIIVWDVPDLGLAPAVAALGADASFLGSAVASSMNLALTAQLAGESGVALFDLFGLQHAIAADPAAYGLVNVTDACGAIVGCDPSTYAFWDGIHPTSAVHGLIAAEMLAVAAVPEPAEYALLLAGLLLVGWRARRGVVRSAGRHATALAA